MNTLFSLDLPKYDGKDLSKEATCGYILDVLKDGPRTEAFFTAGSPEDERTDMFIALASMLKTATIMCKGAVYYLPTQSWQTKT